MKQRIILTAAILLLIVGCTAEPVEVTRVVETVVTRVIEAPATVIVRQEVEVTREVPVTREVEVTRLVERVVAPTPTVSPTPPVDEFALNYLAKEEQGGVAVEVVRVLVANKQLLIDKGLNFDHPLYEPAELVGEIIISMTNKTDRTLTARPWSGSVQINSEQIDLGEPYFASGFGDDLHQNIHPGATRIGGVWFPIKRNTMDDVTAMIFRFEAVSDTNTFEDVTGRFEIQIDVSRRVFEPLPEEIAD